MSDCCSPRRPPHTALRAAFALLAFVLPLQAQAWGPIGHRMVADVADARLSPAAKAEVTRLLATEPGATLGSVASWADETRDPSTASWHWVNFIRGEPCDFQPARLCVDDNCVVGAIQRQVAVLGSKAPDAERLKALKYVVHFIGDIHQPLHGGFADDRGGNGFQLQAYSVGTNLHQVWDSRMIEQWDGGLAALRAAVDAVPPVSDTSLVPVQWVEADCRMVGGDGFYPPTRVLEPAYVRQWGPVLVTRIATAGQRLAATLNRVLATP